METEALTANAAAESGDWNLVYRQVARAKDELSEAQDTEQFQAIGVLCREALISLAQAVYVPAKHPSPDGTQPSKSDAKRMLDAYITAELSGATNGYARKLAHSAVDFAVGFQHSRTADFEHAAMSVAAVESVVSFISITARKADSRQTLAQLFEKFIDEIKPGTSHTYILRQLIRSPIGKVVATELQPRDIVEHCKARRLTVSAATMMQDITYLRVTLARAKDVWKMKVTPELIDQLKPELEKEKLIGRHTPRTRLPSGEEIDRLIRFFQDQKSTNSRTKIPMAELVEFARWSPRRIGEICRLRWDDLDSTNRTCIVRGLKAPRTKGVRHHKFPLLGKAWDIVQRQPRTSDRIFPYYWKSASISYTLAKKRLGIKGLHFNDFRRDAALNLLKAGYSVEQVIKVVGRVDLRPLMKELGL